MIGLRSRFQRQWKPRWELLLRLLVSGFLVLQTQFALAAVPRFFPSLSLFAMLPIAAVVMVVTLGVGRCCRRLSRVSASAPGLVLFNTLFLWGVYVSIIREAIPSLLDATMNAQCALLMFGFCRILSSDAGVVTYGSSHPEGLNQRTYSEVEDALSFSRVRYCKSCSAKVIGYDHHCPAFGNCIGQKNHRLFMVLLLGFIITEASYASCSIQFTWESLDSNKIRLKSQLSMDLAISTLLFSFLQILWQVIFLIWHIYCICFNIKTDEWVHWKKYPEFQVATHPHPGQPTSEVKFWNPYDNGIVGNIKDFLMSE